MLLAAWMGFLVCLLGCVPSTLAGQPCPISKAAKQCGKPSDSCPHHRKQPNNPCNSQNCPPSAACCPAGIVVQKQPPKPQLVPLSSTAAAPAALIAVANASPVGAPNGPPHLLNTGRDILLQSRILRI